VLARARREKNTSRLSMVEMEPCQWSSRVIRNNIIGPFDQLGRVNGNRKGARSCGVLHAIDLSCSMSVGFDGRLGRAGADGMYGLDFATKRLGQRKSTYGAVVERSDALHHYLMGNGL